MTINSAKIGNFFNESRLVMILKIKSLNYVVPPTPDEWEAIIFSCQPNQVRTSAVKPALEFSVNKALVINDRLYRDRSNVKLRQSQVMGLEVSTSGKTHELRGSLPRQFQIMTYVMVGELAVMEFLSQRLDLPSYLAILNSLEISDEFGKIERDRIKEVFCRRVFIGLGSSLVGSESRKMREQAIESLDQLKLSFGLAQGLYNSLYTALDWRGTARLAKQLKQYMDGQLFNLESPFGDDDLQEVIEHH